MEVYGTMEIEYLTEMIGGLSVYVKLKGWLLKIYRQ